MTWLHKWGGHVSDGFYYELLSQGRLKDTEDMEPSTAGLEYYISAFKELNTCRNGSLDLGPIPFDSIVNYWSCFPNSDFEEFLYFIRLLDDTLRKLESNKAKAERQSKG